MIKLIMERYTVLKTLLCFLFVLLLNAHSYANNVFEKDALEKVEKATVLIYLDCVSITPDGLMQTRFNGTGFLISSDGYIITNSHVINHDNIVGGVKVQVENERTYDAKVIRLDNDYDIAIIKLIGEDKFSYFLQLASDLEIVDGSEAFFIGYPLLREFTTQGISIRASIFKGLINRKTQPTYISKKLMDIIEISSDANPGNSGGPLFIPKNGKVIGVVTKRLLEKSTGISFAVPVRYVRSLYFEGSDLATFTQTGIAHDVVENAKIKDIINTILYEFETNLSKIERNSNIFSKNIELLKSKEMLQQIPLDLDVDTWRKIKLENIITFNIIKEDVKKYIEECYYGIETYNEYLKKRKQDLTPINRALSNYSEILLQNEELLAGYGSQLAKLLEDVVKELKKYRDIL